LLHLFVQTFGDLVNFNPHVHALAADGVFKASGRFIPLPAVPEALLAARLRREVRGLLVPKRGKGFHRPVTAYNVLGIRASG
jgi:hypothetical protein